MIQNEHQTQLESPKKLKQTNKTKDAPTPQIRSAPHISKVVDDSASEKSEMSKKDGLSTRSQSPAKKYVK